MLFSIGTQSFKILRNEGYTYVDKTALVYKMVKEGRVYFLGRPRRFGKSLLVSTLKSYFEGRKELFEGLAMEKLEKDWIKYPVLRFDFNSGGYAEEGGLKSNINTQMRKYERLYGGDPGNNFVGDRLLCLIEDAAEKTGLPVVVLIDEYDKPILDAFDTPLESKNKDTLRQFYSALKSAEDSLKFVFLTGVTKFSQVSVFSGFNQLNDISSSSRFDAICGITEEELYTVFAEPIAKMAESENCSVEEMKLKLKKQYDGYHFSEEMLDVYNPFSVMKALQDGNLGNFWFTTGTPSYLVKLLSHTKENLDELAGKYYEADLFKDYKADVEEPLPMIYQSGYLTIKDYNPKKNRYLLDFPNEEVRRGFISLLASTYFKEDESKTRALFNKLSDMLEEGRLKDFVEHLNAYLAGIPYDAHGGIENGRVTESHFQYTFYMIMSMVAGTDQVFTEKRSARGRADCIIEYDDYVYVFEFKLDGSAEEALKQIDEKGYAEPFAAKAKKVIKVGINFSSEKRVITEWLAEEARK